MNHEAALPQPISVLVYPWDYNPYQALLYGAMPPNCVRVAKVRALPKTGPLPFVLGTAYFRARGYRLLHLHWPNFNVPWPRRFALRLSLWSSLVALAWARLLGYSLVWTVHDLLPHEPTTSDDRAVASRLATTSVAVIVHSTAMLQKVRELGAPNAVVIPHGSYVGAYPATTLTPEQARQAIGCDPSRFVFLFFGLLRAYKGVPRLVDCFLGHFAPTDQLVIAGLLLDPSLLPALPDRDTSAVIFHNERVPDSRVSTYYQAADVACLPFERVTTSGSALLALSFGVPIVAPRLGAIIDMPDDVGWFYDPEDAEGLWKAMLRARQASPDERQAKRAAARRHADSLSWGAIASQTMALYRSLTGPHAQPVGRP